MQTTYNILAVGDVCGKPGQEKLCRELPALRKFKNIAFCVVNGENSDMHGILPETADMYFAHGVDVITLGNHTWGKKSIIPYMKETRYLLRPANYAPHAPGIGWTVAQAPFGEVCVINLIGRVGINDMSDNPFFELDRVLEQSEVQRCGVILLDFHAEATSEKLAMRYHADGRLTCVWGTHTHVQTSDAEVTALGLGYITDLGMTGAADSILGVIPKTSLDHFLGNPRSRYESAEGDAKLEGCIFEINAETGRCISAEAIRLL
ncbi:MAG: YmdB family metallophosphoesterase [Oscillospiraceae bacterium]|jgi:metallophosphoesterase (TIGR00282 family)|nr:YmdB family metallophosphoesterase [Oscillospiraceae bacterium]